jgi:hypothetical protein
VLSLARKGRAQRKARFLALFLPALRKAEAAARKRARKDVGSHRYRSFEWLLESSLRSRLATLIVKEWIGSQDLKFWVADLESWLLELLPADQINSLMKEVDRRMTKHAQKLGYVAIRGDFYHPPKRQEQQQFVD